MEAKKTYTTPELRVFGDIRQITQAVDSAGATDGGTVAGAKRT